MKPIYSIFITNRVAANLWNDAAREDPRRPGVHVDIFTYMIYRASKLPTKAEKRLRKNKTLQLPLKNRYALWIYMRAQKYLHKEYMRSEGLSAVDVYDFQSWYFAKYITKILERRKKHEKATDEVEG